MTAWTETACYDFVLRDLLFQGRYGAKPGSYVYNVYVPTKCMYVGKTGQGVRLRLEQHCKEYDAIGKYIILDYQEGNIRCKVVAIDGDLDAAERYYISRSDPEFNSVRYKNSFTLPPTQFADMQVLNIPSMWDARFTPNSIYHDRMIKAREEQLKDYLGLERLYARAYRDPNHPDLRSL